MDNQHVTNRLREFKAKVQEAASKVLRNWDEEGKRVVERHWAEARRSAQLWDEIANGY